jgi:putative N6-adenine-specific DNA methylase
MKYLLTCSAWLESIAKNEILKQWWVIGEVKDRLVFFEWDIDLMVKMNLWSRVWNKVYIVLEEGRANDFDRLYDLIFSINWKKYINDNSPILVKGTTIKSTLTSTPAIQKITKKAIVDKLTNRSWKYLLEDKDLPEYEILTFLMDDKAYILLNTSGDTLYKRWYRVEAWEAPIKESLAAALVLLSNWKFSENFYDITCWSWTIAIEAVMLARNIAPGLKRRFAFEKWSFVPSDLLHTLKKEAQEKVFHKNYNVIASDIDAEILEIAKENAKNAWVLDTIKFIQKDFKDYKKEELSWTIVSNPPYWIRLKDDDLRGLYKDLNMILDKNRDLKWWIITSYTEEFDRIINLNKFKKRKLYNWNEMCYFYTKK